MKFYIVLALALWSAAVHASCQNPRFTEPDRISLDSDSVLIVTHASTTYDPRFSSKRGIDEATSFARLKGIPMVYLRDDTPDQDYFPSDCNPEYWVLSTSGELGFQIQPSHVYIAGGHLEQCLYSTVQEVIQSWSEQPERDLTLVFLMDAIYSNGDLVSDNDDYHQAFSTFMRVLTHGRSANDPWPKVTLLETMGLIGRPVRELDYLRRALPNYQNSLPPDYRVELQLNNSEVKVLQDGPAWIAPTLRFRFVDSAQTLDAI